ncbi:hypothetical protein Pmani_010572 [Petrolisthes manimaculis]|uniref:Uncharacterized protein n=1 Tax=Petrolisthes manimaculis TaxID=1843537 RepID=A0AAE1Q1G4_9EUCA|nr:hypothetical protein Pmani_010572 [Petrolisthes manimaculis]
MRFSPYDTYWWSGDYPSIASHHNIDSVIPGTAGGWGSLGEAGGRWGSVTGEHNTEDHEAVPEAKRS